MCRTFIPKVHGLAEKLMLTVFVWAVPVMAQSQAPTNQASAGGAVPSGPTFRMVRATSGSKGVERDGRFVIEDPRTQFHAGQDHKVIVYFEWEGTLGPHKFEALWKNPSGKVVVVSDFQFEPHGLASKANGTE